MPIEPVREAAASAPKANEAETVVLEPITATATRTPHRVYELPESVSVVSAQSIENLGASSLGEALSLANGISLSGGPRANAQSVVVRGLSGTRVLVSVDGARQNYDGAHRSRLTLDPDLLKSVDVLRGPASAIWGSDALGGVISMTTKDAADFLKDDEQLGARLKLGSESASNEVSRGGSLFARLGSLDFIGDFVGRSHADIEQADGKTLPHSALDADGQLFKLTNFFSEANELSVSHQGFRQRGASPSNPANEVTSSNPLLERDNDQTYQTARYTYQDSSGEGLFAGGNVTLYRSALDVVEDRVGNPRHDTLKFDTTGGSVQSTLALPNWLSRITLGGEAYEDSASATRDGAPRAQFPDSTRSVKGVFLQNEFEFGDWSLTPGVRHDRYRSHSNTEAARDIEASATSLKFGSSYAVNDWLSLNAVYGEAFRAPSLLESYAQGQHFLGNEFRPNAGLLPERARNRELGFRLRFNDLSGVDDRLVLKLSAFDNRVRDYIETVVVVETQGPFPPATHCAPPAPAVGCVNRNEDGTANPMVPVLIFVGGYTTSENLTQARLRGLEVESVYDFAAFNLNLGYSRTRGVNEENGMPLLSIPADKFTAQFGYRVLPNLNLGLRAVRAAAQDRVPLLEDGTPAIPTTAAYTVTSAFLTWQPQRAFDGLKLTLGADNLGNTLYREHLSNFNEAGRSLRAGLSYLF